MFGVFFTISWSMTIHFSDRYNIFAQSVSTYKYYYIISCKEFLPGLW